MQTIDSALFEDLEVEFEKEVKKKVENNITTSTIPQTDWMQKICAKVNISDLASEFGVDECPLCSYPVNFDDSRGFFCCVKKKYENACDFAGNIVEFMKRCKR